MSAVKECYIQAAKYFGPLGDYKPNGNDRKAALAILNNCLTGELDAGEGKRTLQEVGAEVKKLGGPSDWRSYYYDGRVIPWWVIIAFYSLGKRERKQVPAGGTLPKSIDSLFDDN